MYGLKRNKETTMKGGGTTYTGVLKGKGPKGASMGGGTGKGHGTGRGTGKTSSGGYNKSYGKGK